MMTRHLKLLIMISFAFGPILIAAQPSSPPQQPDTKSNSGNLVVDRTIGGPATGAESIPGQVRMVQVIEDGETFLDLPPNITYALNIESIGQ